MRAVNVILTAVVDDVVQTMMICLWFFPLPLHRMLLVSRQVALADRGDGSTGESLWGDAMALFSAIAVRQPYAVGLEVSRLLVYR